MVSRRARRWLTWSFTITVTIAVVVLLGATWYYSEQLDSEMLQAVPWEPEQDVEVIAVGEQTVVLSLTAESLRAGRQGLVWDDGYAEIGDVVARNDTQVTRLLLGIVVGDLTPGVAAGIDGMAFLDPEHRGVDVSEVIVEGPLGDHPAWRTEGTDDTWVIFVHGKGASPREALRMLPVAVDLGLPGLVITYRNDEGAPETDTKRHAIGSTEWEDLQAAVEYALIEGAEEVVIVGYSMGGSITATFLYESHWEDRVAAIVLDAPLADVGAVVDDEAEALNVPGFVTGWAKALATLRFGLDWGDLDHVDRAEEIEVPVLLFHGDADTTINVDISDAFAEALGDSVIYERVAGAEHVQAWNVAPERYEALVRAFLTEHAVGPTDLPRLGRDNGVPERLTAERER
jgi:pimeloyl-ACP methyl ester carboxylesterase